LGFFATSQNSKKVEKFYLISNVKAQMSNECQNPKSKRIEMIEVFYIWSFGFDLLFGFCHLTFFLFL